jgi:hypothetical protein
MIEPDLRCIEFVELVTDWAEGALDDVTVGRPSHVQEVLAEYAQLDHLVNNASSRPPPTRTSCPSPTSTGS